MVRRVTLAAVALLVLAIVAGSLMPFEDKIRLGTPFRYVVVSYSGFVLHINAHRTIHVAMFFLTALLALSLVHSWRSRIKVTAAVCLIALLVEVLEVRTYHNVMEWWDVQDDLMGVLAALAVNALWNLRRGNSNPAASEK